MCTGGISELHRGETQTPPSALFLGNTRLSGSSRAPQAGRRFPQRRGASVLGDRWPRIHANMPGPQTLGIRHHDQPCSEKPLGPLSLLLHPPHPMGGSEPLGTVLPERVPAGGLQKAPAHPRGTHGQLAGLGQQHGNPAPGSRCGPGTTTPLTATANCSHLKERPGRETLSREHQQWGLVRSPEAT